MGGGGRVRRCQAKHMGRPKDACARSRGAQRAESYEEGSRSRTCRWRAGRGQLWVSAPAHELTLIMLRNVYASVVPFGCVVRDSRGSDSEQTKVVREMEVRTLKARSDPQPCLPGTPPHVLSSLSHPRSAACLHHGPSSTVRRQYFDVNNTSALAASNHDHGTAEEAARAGGAAAAGIVAQRVRAETQGRADGSELRIPFMNAQHAAIAKRSLDVDREPNLELVERRTAVDGDVLVV